MAAIAPGASVLVGELPGKVLQVWNAANGMRKYGNVGLILLENGKRITADLSQVTVVAAEVAASGGMAPIIKPLVMVVVTAAVHFVPGVGPVVGSMLSWGLSLAPVVVPAALRAMQGHDQDNTHH